MLPLLFASNLPKRFCPFGSQLSLFLNPPFLCVPSNFHLSSASLEQNWWQVSSHMASRLLAPEGDMVHDLRLEEHLQADFKHLPVLCPEDSSLPSSSASQPSCTRLTRPFHNSLIFETLLRAFTSATCPALRQRQSIVFLPRFQFYSSRGSSALNDLLLLWWVTNSVFDLSVCLRSLVNYSLYLKCTCFLKRRLFPAYFLYKSNVQSSLSDVDTRTVSCF